MKALSIHRPRPSMLMRISASRGTMVRAREVNCPPISVEDLGLAIAGQHLLQRGNAKAGVHRVRQSPSQHLAGCRVHDHHQVQETATHRDIGHVSAPHVIGPLVHQRAQQIPIGPVLQLRVQPLAERCQTHFRHEPPLQRRCRACWRLPPHGQSMKASSITVLSASVPPVSRTGA